MHQICSSGVSAVLTVTAGAFSLPCEDYAQMVNYGSFAP